MSNPYEEAGRLRKCAALVAEFRAAQIGSDLVALMDYPDWVAVAAKAGVKPPSDETKAAVIAELQRTEALEKSTVPAMISRPGPHVGGGYAEIANGIFVRTGRRP